MTGIKIITRNCAWKAGFAFLLAMAAAAPFESFPADNTDNVERVDLFELTYAYEACEIEHTEIQRHGPHWVWWKKDAIFCLIDTKQSSWIQTSGDTDFAATFRLKAPVNVSRVSITTKTLFKSDEYNPVQWILEKLDEKGNVVGIVAESTAKEPKDDEVRLSEPILLQFFRLRAFPVDEKGSPLPSRDLETSAVGPVSSSLTGARGSSPSRTRTAVYTTQTVWIYPPLGNIWTLQEQWKVSTATGSPMKNSSPWMWIF